MFIRPRALFNASNGTPQRSVHFTVSGCYGWLLSEVSFLDHRGHENAKSSLNGLQVESRGPSCGLEFEVAERLRMTANARRDGKATNNAVSENATIGHAVLLQDRPALLIEGIKPNSALYRLFVHESPVLEHRLK